MTLASEVLGSPELKGLKNARVSMTFMVDNGRENQTFRYFRILTPKPVTNLVWTGNLYTCEVFDNHGLNATGVRNRIHVVKNDRASTASIEAQISFEIVLDGTPLTADDGQIYVFALRSSGPHVFQNGGELPYPPNDFYAYNGIRDDLHVGNDEDYTGSALPATDEWLRSYVRSVDIELVDADVQVLRSRPGYRRGHFS